MVSVEKVGQKMVDLLKHLHEEKKQEEEEKGEELSLEYITDLAKNGYYKSDDDEETKLGIGEIIKQFFVKLSEMKQEDYAKDEVPKFVESIINSAQLDASDWKKALSDNVVGLESYVSEAPHLVGSFIKAMALPLICEMKLLKMSDITWIDAENSFDVWPQYAVLGSILDTMIKDQGDQGIETFNENAGDILE